MKDEELRQLSHRLHDDIISNIDDYNSKRAERERKERRYTIEGVVIFAMAVGALGFYLYAMWSTFLR